MEFVSGAQSCTCVLPKHGYMTTLNIALDIQTVDNGRISIYDDGIANDIRYSDIDVIYTIAEAAAFNAFFSTTARGRGNNCTLTLLSGSGFFPFGPDKGDAGSFTVSAEIISQEGIGDVPFNWFRARLRLRAVGYPDYSLPAEIDDGPLSIGTVDGLRQPQERFDISAEYAQAITATPSGVYYFDRGTDGDVYKSSFKLNQEKMKAGALIYYLQNTVRGNQFAMTVPSVKTFPFGYDKGNSTINCKLASASVLIRHISLRDFETTLLVAVDQ
jgi:hypothetical protein